jgi:hypothetical protein
MWIYVQVGIRKLKGFPLMEVKPPLTTERMGMVLWSESTVQVSRLCSVQGYHRSIYPRRLEILHSWSSPGKAEESLLLHISPHCTQDHVHLWKISHVHTPWHIHIHSCVYMHYARLCPMSVMLWASSGVTSPALRGLSYAWQIPTLCFFLLWEAGVVTAQSVQAADTVETHRQWVKCVRMWARMCVLPGRLCTGTLGNPTHPPTPSNLSCLSTPTPSLSYSRAELRSSWRKGHLAC